MIEYCIRVSCDVDGCKAAEYFTDTSQALHYDWCMVPGQWLCPEHSYQWRMAQNHEPTDEELLA